MKELQLKVIYKSEAEVDGKTRRLVSFEITSDGEPLAEAFDMEVTEEELAKYPIGSLHALSIGQEMSTLDIEMDNETMAKLEHVTTAVGISMDQLVQHILMERIIMEALKKEGLAGGAKFVSGLERTDFRKYLDASEALGQDPYEGLPVDSDERDGFGRDALGQHGTVVANGETSTATDDTDCPECGKPYPKAWEEGGVCSNDWHRLHPYIDEEEN